VPVLDGIDGLLLQCCGVDISAVGLEKGLELAYMYEYNDIGEKEENKEERWGERRWLTLTAASDADARRSFQPGALWIVVLS
jgi:hypothetical protein